MKKCIETKPDGRRMVGRPERKLLEDEENDSRELMLRISRKTANSREEWMQKRSRSLENHRKRE
jgi:hypothetical protein